MSRLEEIRARADAASPGPWEWRGNAKYHSIRLITWMKGLGIGQTTVMDFARAGMHDAEPRFRDEDFMMKRGRDLVRYEVCHDATSRDDSRVYRHDIDGIRHPDAEFIAHSRDDVEWLLNRVSELEAAVTELTATQTPITVIQCGDMEERATVWNEGYEAAMSQHLADDPSAAEDWLNEQKATAWDEGRRHGSRFPYGERGLATDDNPYRTEGQ